MSIRCWIVTVVDFKDTTVKYTVFTEEMKRDTFVHNVEKRKDTVTNPSTCQKTPRYSAFVHLATME